MLRNRAGSPWVRFHALPGSKRYADDQAERNIILSRAYALGDELLGVDQCCWVVEAETGDPSAPSEVALSGAETDDPDEPVWSFYARRERWRAGTHDAKLMSIADDEPRRAICVNRRPKRTPYRRPKETPFVGQRYGDDGRAVRAGCGVGRA
ncbi:DUF3885 domain-containing protein [Sphingomonas aurantiaca]